MSQNVIRLRGARQNNLKNLDVDLPLGELVVITGLRRWAQVIAARRSAGVSWPC